MSKPFFPMRFGQRREIQLAQETANLDAANAAKQIACITPLYQKKHTSIRLRGCKQRDCQAHTVGSDFPCQGLSPRVVLTYLFCILRRDVVVGFSTYREAAGIFRAVRAKGVAVTAIDVLIAAIALEHGATLFTLDKDFTRIASIIRLPLYVY